jgi:hypothetical protein
MHGWREPILPPAPSSILAAAAAVENRCRPRSALSERLRAAFSEYTSLFSAGQRARKQGQVRGGSCYGHTCFCSGHTHFCSGHTTICSGHTGRVLS